MMATTSRTNLQEPMASTQLAIGQYVSVRSRSPIATIGTRRWSFGRVDHVMVLCTLTTYEAYSRVIASVADDLDLLAHTMRWHVPWNRQRD